MSTLADLPIERVELTMPRYGAWRADVTLSSGTPPSGQVTLVIAKLELVGAVTRAGLDSADCPRLVVVGAPGWGRTLEKPLSYQSDAGVRLKTVLRDLAKLADETIVQPDDAPIGQHFEAIPTRAVETRLRDVLSALHRVGHVPRWRVDPDGVTRFGARTGEDVTDKVRVLRRNAGLGMRRLSSESAADFLPGNEVEGEAIERVTIYETAGHIVAEAWAA